MHDVSPVRRPEWCDHGLVRAFRAWYGAVLPLADVIFANSHATAADVRGFAEEAGLALRAPVVALPIGTGFTALPAAAGPDVANPALPAPGGYALVVSTIEARKNHALLFRVWRRLLEDMPEDRVPTLVFAGRVGWMVADLMRQLDNANHLDGKIVLVSDASDADLAQLYRGCLFTLFPSFYEGWGLPVTESLAMGKPCVISDRTALPEAGGDLARYFDPDNANDAYRVIRDTIEDRAGLAAWEADVRARFTPTPWSATAQALVGALK